MDEKSQLAHDSEQISLNREKSTTPTIIDVINIIVEKVDPVLRIITTTAERMLKSKEAEVRFRLRMAWVAVIVVTLIVVTAGILTYTGKVDGSTFGFLLGLIVGYVLTFIRDAIQPPPQE